MTSRSRAHSSSDAKRVDINISSVQAAAITSDKEMTVVFGGYGSGKTTVGTMWSINRAMSSPKGTIGLIAANSYMQLFDSTMMNFYKNTARWGIRVLPKDRPNMPRPFNFALPMKGKTQVVYCRSLDNYNLLEGTEFAWAWLDETYLTKRAAFETVQARLRDKSVKINHLLITTIIDDPTDSWLYDSFVKDYDPKMMNVLYAPTVTNAANLPPNYIPRLRKMLAPPLFRSRVECIWTMLARDTIYYSFSADRNVTENIGVDPNLPILWSHDFNVGQGKPMSSIIAQVRKGRSRSGEVRPELHVLDEIVLERADTKLAIKEVIDRYGEPRTRHYIVYGDASGQAKDTRSGQTDYTILANAGFHEQKIPSTNPPIRDRHNSVNSLLFNAEEDIRCFIHPRCKNLIKGLQTVGYKKGSKHQEEETYEQHVTTAFGYLIHVEFPIQNESNLSIAVSSTGREMSGATDSRTNYDGELI